MTVLQAAIKAFRFEEAFTILKNDNSLAHATDDNDGRLPLHLACASKPNTTEKRNQLVQLISNLISVYPDGLSVKDDDGRLAIHYAVKNKSTEDIIKPLVEKNPQGLEVADGGGFLPLHIAVRANYSSVLKLLVETYPEALSIADKTGKLPLHYGVSCEVLERPKLYEMTCYAEALELEYLTLLVSKYPDAVTKTDNTGKLPLHIACDNGDSAEHEQACILHLAQCFPDGLRMKDKKGNLPIHYAATCCDPGTLKLLVKAYPECVKETNASRQLPVSVAAKRYNWEGVEFFATQYPDGLLEADNDGNLPIHYQATDHSILSVYEDRAEEGLMHKNKKGQLPIDRTVPMSAQFFSLARKCPQSLFPPGRVPFQFLIPYLKEGRFSKGRTENVARMLELSMPFFDTNASQNVSSEGKQQLEKKMKEQSQAFSQEKEALQQTHLAETSQLQQQINSIKTDSASKVKQLEGHLNTYKLMASESRKAEKRLLATLLDHSSESEASMDTMKAVATSLKKRLDALKANINPEAKPSLMQSLFSAIITNPNLSREELITTIEALNAELLGLEADIEETLKSLGSADASEEAASTPATTTTASIEADSSDDQRPVKRHRVSLP